MLHKNHFLVALIIGIWLTFFLILIAPFDIVELPILARLEILPVYGLISFIGYMAIVPFQHWIYKKIKSPIYSEVLIVTLFNILVLIGSYIYYKSDVVNGTFSFAKFTLEAYYPTFFILLPIIIFARWYLSKKSIQNKITITGDNKLDILQINNDDLVCVSSADNYVEVSYLVEGILNKKLLRTTLKNIESEFPELMKVHRSHIINPIHFKEWKDSNTIFLTQKEVPVSKNYKKQILTHIHSPLKTMD